MHSTKEDNIGIFFLNCFSRQFERIAKVIGNIARARGMTQLAKDTGLGRESLYKALSGEGNPSFSTILKVIAALGIKLHAETASA